jgi:hypothetical protein
VLLTGPSYRRASEPEPLSDSGSDRVQDSLRCAAGQYRRGGRLRKVHRVRGVGGVTP